MGWLTGYGYRIKGTVVATAAGAQTNYQVKVVVYEGSGENPEAYCEGHCVDFPYDIRFTAADGETKHDYWVDTGSWSGSAPNRQVDIWVEVASVPDSGTVDLYMYYGKSGDGGDSNGENTFQFFDDFERGINGDEIGGSWTEDQGTVEISTGQKFGDTRSMLLKGAAGAKPIAHFTQLHSDNIAVQFRLYKETASSFECQHGDGTKKLWAAIDINENIKYVTDGGTLDTGSDVAPDTWALIEFQDFDWAAHTYDIIHNGTPVQNDAAMYSNIYCDDHVSFRGLDTSGADTWIDNVLVRKYALPEPTLGSWGDEQTEKTKESSISLTIVDIKTKESSIGLRVVEPDPYMIDRMDETTNWGHLGAGEGPTLNTTTKHEGSGSLNLIKNTAFNYGTWYNQSNVTPINLTNAKVKFWLYIKDATARNKLSQAKLTLWTSSQSYARWNFPVAGLSIGWNLLVVDTTTEPDDTAGTPDFSSINGTYIYLHTNNASDTYAAGDMLADHIHFSDQGAKESSIGLRVVTQKTKESSIGLRVVTQKTKESSIGLRVVTQKTKESSIGLAIQETFTKESSIGLTIQETSVKESSIGLTIQETFTKESSIGLRVIHQKTKTSSIGLTIQETSVKESSIGLTIQETFTKESSIGLRVIHQKTKTSSIGLTIQETSVKESSIGISVGAESEVVSIIGIRVVNSETKESTLGMTISGEETKESSINLSILGTFVKDSTMGISVQETFTKESSIGLRVVTQKTKESSINLTVWDTPIKESSIGMYVLAYQLKDSTIGMYVEGANTKDSSIGITVSEPVLKKGFYYAKLGNTALEGVEEDNFRISKEINQIPSFNYEIANCAVNRTTIADNITEEFKIYWRHHGTDTHIFTGIINADGIEYISLDSIEITGYASYVVLSWPLLKHLAAEDAEPVNKVFDFYGAYTDLTTPANNATINDVVLSLSSGNHGLYIGEKQPFWGAQIKYSTKGVRPEGCSIVLEYSKGGGIWGTLDALDESDAFTEDPGTYNLIIAHPPSDWVRNTVDGVSRYWIRWRLAAGVYTTPPKLDRIYIVNVDVYRTYYFDTSARAILLDALEGTDYTMDATDSCPEDIISVVAEYESPLRVIAAIPNALTWTDDESSKKSYQWWIDDNKKVHIKQQRGTAQPDDITGDMTIFNNHEDYFHLSNRLIGLGPRDGLGQMRAIIEDKTSIATHTLREIAVAKDQSLKYNMLKTSLEKDLAISKNPMQRIRGKVTTEFWGLRGYEVGDTVTLHQGKWNVAEKAFQIVKAEIGPNTTTIDLGISQDHLNGLRDSLQRQLTLNNVRMHGSTTLLEAGPVTSNYQRINAETVYSAKLEIEIPTTVKKVHKVLLSWTLGPYRAAVNPNTGTIPAHDHEGTAGVGGAVESFEAGAGGAFTPEVGDAGGFTPKMLSKAHKHYVDDTLTIVYSTHQRFMLDFPDNGKVFGGNHRHIKGKTDAPDEVVWVAENLKTGSACATGFCITGIEGIEVATLDHWHLNTEEFAKYTNYTSPTMHVNGTTEYVVYEINPYIQHSLSQNESPAHVHDGVAELDHDHPGVAELAHSDHTIPLLVGHTDHSIISDTGGTVAIDYGIYEVAGGTDMELLVNGESVGIYTTAPQTEIRIDGWLNSGNNTVELRPKVGENNKKGGATLKATGVLFVEPIKF